jgi:glycine cleavage system aminomethyltransferase T
MVTSSTLSPMLGSVPIAFAMLKASHAEPGATVIVSAEGEHVEATVGPLCFHPGVTS